MNGLLMIRDFGTRLNRPMRILNLKFPRLDYFSKIPWPGLLLTSFIIDNNFSRLSIIKHIFHIFFNSWKKNYRIIFHGNSLSSSGFARRMDAASCKFVISNFFTILKMKLPFIGVI